MNEADLLHELRTSSEARKILADDFDFEPVPPSTTSSLFQFNDGTSFELVGIDSTGGEFALCERRSLPTRPLLYASSEGQAGVLARSLESGLSTLVDLPYWYDCLKFSGGGLLAEMRRVVPLSESDLIAENPQIVSRRGALRTILGLAQIPDSVQALHSALTELSPLYLVFGPDDSQFDPLFNRFTVTSNPEWRERLELQ